MKFLPASLPIALLFGFASSLAAQTAPGPNFSGAVPSGNIGSTQISSNAAGASRPKPGASPDEEEKTYEEDDALYRGKTSETEVTMMRDEGPLHFKKHPKEKVQEVGSLKDLKSAPTDRNFEGNLLHSSVTSIEDVLPKEVPPSSEATATDSRFKNDQSKFDSEKQDKPKAAQAASSPSPTPTPTATVSAHPEKSNKEN